MTINHANLDIKHEKIIIMNLNQSVQCGEFVSSTDKLQIVHHLSLETHKSIPWNPFEAAVITFEAIEAVVIQSEMRSCLLSPRD